MDEYLIKKFLKSDNEKFRAIKEFFESNLYEMYIEYVESEDEVLKYLKNIHYVKTSEYRYIIRYENQIASFTWNEEYGQIRILKLFEETVQLLIDILRGKENGYHSD